MMKFHRDTEAMKLECFEGAHSDVINAVCREIIEGWQVKIQLARAKQARKKAELDRLKGYAIEGIGEHFLSVDRESYMYWGTREGFECWDDLEFLREYHRDNETARVDGLKRTNRITVPDTWQGRLHATAVRRGMEADKPRVLVVNHDFTPHVPAEGETKGGGA